MNVRFGKTTIDVKGCYKCGTYWSSGWHVYKVIPVHFGNTKSNITIHICADCAKMEKEL